MKKLNYLNVFCVAAFLILGFSNVYAQDASPVSPENTNQKKAENSRPNLLTELDLTSEQIRRIRLINTENKTSLRAAQQRLRAANQNLDRAIYADNLDEGAVQTLVKEAQAAQTELIKLRSETELAVRRVLTQEQLIKFRDLRRQFAERLENRPNQLRKRRLRFPNRKFNTEQRVAPPTN